MTAAAHPLTHNSNKWRAAKNRHTNTDGTDWGWIDGPEKNVYWSDEKSRDNTGLKSADAYRLVAEHNAWLEKQTPSRVRLLQAREHQQRLRDDMDRAKAAYDEATEKWRAAFMETCRLSREHCAEEKYE